MKFQKKVGTAGILFASISAMIGSGWLFSSLYAAQIAGPAAIISWLLAGFIIIVIALTFAEVGSLFPIAGGIANYPYFTQKFLCVCCCSFKGLLLFVTCFLFCALLFYTPIILLKTAMRKVLLLYWVLWFLYLLVLQ